MTLAFVRSGAANGTTGLAGTRLATNLRALTPLVPFASARRARNEPELGTNLRALIPLVLLASARRARNEPEPAPVVYPYAHRGFRENMRKFNEFSLKTTSGAPL